MATQIWTGAVSTDPTNALNWVSLTAPVTGDTILFGNGVGALQNPVTWTAGSIVYGAIDATGYTSTMTVGSNVLSCSGSVTLPTGMTFTTNSASQLVLSGTGTVTTGTGILLPQTTTINAPGGTVTQGSNWTLAGTTASILTLTAGTWDTGGTGFSVTCGIVNANSASTRQINLNNSSVTCSASTSVVFDLRGAGALTFNAGGSTVTASGSNATIQTFQNTFNNVVMSGAGTAVFAGPCTLANFTRTGSAAKTDATTFSSSAVGNYTITGGLHVTSNSAVNRLLLQSNVVGTAVNFVMTGATVTIDNTAAATGSSVDFMDINITGSPTWTVLHSTLVGDCGGNGGAVTTNATASATQTCSAPNANVIWSTFAWSGAGGANRVPLPQDDVVLTGNFGTSHTVTGDMPRLGRSIDWTGATFTTALTFATGSTAVTIFGSYTQISTSGFTVSGTSSITFAGRGSYSITSALNATNKFTQQIVIQAPTGTYTLNDALTTTSGLNMNVPAGTFTTNGNSIQANGFSYTGVLTKVLNLGVSTITLTGIGIIVNSTSTGTTINGGSATVVINDSSASSKTLAIAGFIAPQAFPTVSYTNAGTGSLIFSGGGNIILGLNISGAARTVTVTHGVTYTVTTFTGGSGPMTINSDTTAISTIRTADGRFQLGVTSTGCQFSALSWTANGAPTATLTSTVTTNASIFTIRGASPSALATLNASTGASQATLTMSDTTFALAEYCTVTDIIETNSRLLVRNSSAPSNSTTTIDHALLASIGAG